MSFPFIPVPTHSHIPFLHPWLLWITWTKDLLLLFLPISICMAHGIHTPEKDICYFSEVCSLPSVSCVKWKWLLFPNSGGFAVLLSSPRCTSPLLFWFTYQLESFPVSFACVLIQPKAANCPLHTASMIVLMNCPHSTKISCYRHTNISHTYTLC